MKYRALTHLNFFAAVANLINELVDWKKLRYLVSCGWLLHPDKIMFVISENIPICVPFQMSPDSGCHVFFTLSSPFEEIVHVNNLKNVEIDQIKWKSMPLVVLK